MIWNPKGALWSQDWTLQNTTPFDWSPAPLHLTPEQMLDIAETRWNQPESELRFAWQWANWDESERFKQTTGAKGDATELAQVMMWTLSCSPKLWQHGTCWEWGIWGQSREETDEDNYWLRNHSDGQFNPTDELMAHEQMEEWSQLLQSYFMPQWRKDWIEKYVCVRNFWIYRPLCEVELTSPPTMHEQIEARLLLKDWLEGKTTPDEASRLISLL
ncbi:hypothetical protein EON83_01255 [bacterium]|nr:MAG: hypothetical protein EON83_01255 [bacterium]